MKQFISRRAFAVSLLRSSAATFAGVGVHSMLFSQEPSSRVPKSARKYFDIHTHIAQAWESGGPMTTRMLLNWMDAHEIEQATVLPLISPESWYYPISTDYVLKETKNHRDRLIPFCCVDPRTANLNGYKGYVRILKRYVDAGAKGFGEHKWGGPVDDPKSMELLQACVDTKLPVLIHIDGIRNMDAVGLPGLEKVLKAFPEGKFIGHANGFWASISKDVKLADFQTYPRGPITPGGALDRLLSDYKNLYCDLSANSGANALRRDKKFSREFLIRHADQILFGTDYLKDKQEVQQFELLEAFDLPEEVQTKIYQGNAKQLLGLK